MTVLNPVLLSGVIERSDWSAFASFTARTFFEKHGEMGAAVMMLVPRPNMLPLVVCDDEYSTDEEHQAQLHESLTADIENAPVNAHGECVIVFPIEIKNAEHKQITIELIKHTARAMNATAVATVAECWLRRDVNGPSGTGDDVLMLHIERDDGEPLTMIAPIENASTPRAVLREWRVMQGRAVGPFCDILPSSSLPSNLDDNDAAQEPMINVGIVGEA